MAAKQFTYGKLGQLLSELGFVCRKGKTQVRWYEHKDTDTVIILNDGNPRESARPTEIASARYHLVHKGFLSEEEFDQYAKNGLIRR
jgi:hypothetical protein